MKKFPQVKVIKETVQGMIPARNAGFNAAGGDIIARTDADTIVPKDWIKKIKKRFEDDPELWALSGPAIFQWAENTRPLTKFQSRLYFRSYNESIKLLIGHDGLNGPNYALTKSAWEKVKDEACLDDHKVHEDIDLCIHIGRYGKIVFDLNLLVNSSARRWGKIKSLVEYPYRYLKTVRLHSKILRPSRFRSFALQSTSLQPQVSAVKSKLQQHIRVFKELSHF